MYAIVAGKVNAFANYGKENEKLLNTIEQGELFGELGLTGFFQERPRL